MKAICRVLGVADLADPDAPLGPFLPPVVQVPASDSLSEGDEVLVLLRVRVQQVVPGDLPPLPG